MAAERRSPALPRVVSIVGTRPEAIKLRPVVRALLEGGAAEPLVILTGQHRGLAGLFDFLPRSALGQLRLNPAEQSAGEFRDAVFHALCGCLDHRKVALLLVQGDTSSAYGGALAARDCGIPLGHVEAGLRSFDMLQPWPEESYRVAIDTLADLLFAPSESAVRNLLDDSAVRGAIHLTGNSGIDALLEMRPAAPARLATRDGRKPILLTCHRRENRGEPLRRIAAACRELVRTLPVSIIAPLHPNPAARATFQRLLGSEPHIRLTEPLRYKRMLAVVEGSWLILSDSGGLQEEAPALGRPLLILRDKTERPEVIATGNALLVATDPDRIVAAVRHLTEDPAAYERMSVPAFPYGRGDAAERIAGVITAFLQHSQASPRSTLSCPPTP